MLLYTGTGGRVRTAMERLDNIAGVGLEYGRASGTGYCLLRIPQYSIDGRRILPGVALTADKGGAARSALTYARQTDALCVINGGLFHTATLLPQGQTVVAGVSVTNSPMTDDRGTAISDAECYPLCIDKQGELSSPYSRGVDTADMIADGVMHAVTGWGQLLENFVKTGADKFNEIVHTGRNVRQCIGQYDNGDYVVCTVDCARNGISANDAGMTYGALAELLMGRGVKFAYSLDGGGSAETVLGLRQVNPVYEGRAGRAVPTVIRFDVVDV